MITLQRTIGYAGDLAAAPQATVMLAFGFPVYAFTSVDGRMPPTTRQDTGSVSTWNVSHSLTSTDYRLTPGNGAVTGNDDTVLDDVQRYYLNALRAGVVSDLAVPVTVRFSVPGGIELSEQELDALCLVKLPLQPASLSAGEAARETESPADFILLNRPAFEHLKTQVAASLKVGDNLVLALISMLTVFDGGAPSISAASSTEIKHLVEGAKTGATAAEMNRLVKLIRAASSALFDFQLVVPEMRTLAIGGSFTVLTSDGRPAVAADLQKFEITAECAYGDENGPRQLMFRFGDDVTITGGAATFSLTAGTALLRNGLQDPVRILVKGLDGAVVWSEEHPAADPALAGLAIRVQAQSAATLNGVPSSAEPDPSKKLRGQVLTFAKDCPLRGALVLIQAKADGDTDWHIVGVGTTDSSGAFTIPYPYGTYTDARAVVSLAPDESAPITVHRDLANATIADDVLYLLLKNPRCPEPKDGDDCGCDGQTDVGNRLPDHADLIGSDAYSQDIGGGCVNLSKPNRTINEYAYSGIVRTSDPDVANYTLTRYEAGLEDIDVHLLASISSGAAGLAAAVATALANATTIDTGTPNAFTRQYLTAVNTALSHVNTIKAAVAAGAPPLGLTELATLQTHIDSVIAVMDAYKSMAEANDGPLIDDGGARVVEAAAAVRTQVALAIDAVGVAVRYELTGGTLSRSRKPVALDNPVLWQDAPEPLASSRIGPMMGHAGVLAKTKLDKFGGVLQTSSGAATGQPAATLAQAVSVATGHVLHFKAVVKADGYSLGDLLYSLPLAPGQKKEIVVFDASHSLVGAETQTLTQNERLATGLVSERAITDQLTGSISESMRGSSTADTQGISAGFGTGGQGYGGTGAYGGSGSAVIGVAGGWAQAGSDAQQDSSRNVAQYFGEKLRESVMQNADGYRRLNASVVTTVQEGQRYGVTSEVVANHNHCHALTVMYFEVLRHFAVFQELASAEECVFIPLLLARFTTENVGKWRDVLAPALLPLPSDTYLQPQAPNISGQHPLVKAFDADQRIRTHYANVDFPAGAYDEERIQYIRGTVRLRIDLPRPRTRFDRILSFPVVKQLDVQALATAGAKFAQDAASYATKAALTAGFYTLFQAPPSPPNPEQFEVLAREAVFDTFMRLDGNYQTVPPAQCMRIMDFTPKPVPVLSGLSLTVNGPLNELDFFAENRDDRNQWELYSKILGYSSVGEMLNAHFKGNLISEWDTIFEQDIAPLIFEKILDAIRLDQFSTDFSSAEKYHSGERVMVVDLIGTTPKSRNQLPSLLTMSVSNPSLRGLKNYVTLYLDSASIGYSTAHFNGALFDGPVRNDLLDDTGAALPIPENSEDKRNPRREDRYLAARLIEHLNSNLEYYNKVLWYHLDPDRRFMLLDGFSIQVYDSEGKALSGQGGLRSLASVVKNEVISVAGNALVMPVAPGYRVSGSFISVKPDDEARRPTLLDHYQPLTPVPPYRLSVPSKGVFAEAVMGACNSCEKLEPDRMQDWSQYPIGDEPPAISPVTVPTPAVTDWQAAFKDFAAPIVNVQNAPAAPAPGAGLAGLSQLLGQAGVFKDITGLDANQQNVLKTYLSNQENAKAFAEMAKEMAMQTHNTQNSGKIMDSITAAKNSGAITQTDASQLVKDHLQQQIDGGAGKKATAEAQSQAAATPLSQAAVTAAGQGKDVTASRLDSAGNSESVTIHGPDTSRVLAEAGGIVPHLRQQKRRDCWAVAAAMLIGWSRKQSAITPADAVTPAGQKYLKIYTDDTGLFAEDKDDFLLRSRMVAEPPASYRLDQYIDWVKTYGPVWVTTDASPGQEYSPHARVLIQISGTGTPDGTGTYFTLIDPSTGTEVTQPFSEFIRGYEQMVTDNPTDTLFPQVVHFIETKAKPEGFQIEGPFNIHEPIHETITLAALMRSNVPVPAGVTVGSDPATDEFLRGVIWNDDPAVLMFDEDPKDNWNFSLGIAWYVAFSAAEHATMNNLTNLTGRSHFFDLQFLHAMAEQPGELPEDTLAKIMLWAEVMYRLSINEGVSGTSALASIPIASNVTAAVGATYSYTLPQFFDAYTSPKGTDTMNQLLTLDTACIYLDLKRRAIGSLLHMVQDSYARGHVRRTLTNPGDLVPGKTDEFQPGTYGHYGEVENFHCYRGQDSSLHDKYDKPASGTLRAGDINSFNTLPGARDAVNASLSLLNMWQLGTPWAAAGGPKELLEGTVFKLAATATPADTRI